MRTPRAIALFVVSFIVSAMVAGTALGQPQPDPSASASGSASPPTPPPPSTSDDWKKCVDDCGLVGKLVCGTDAAIQDACKGVPSCDALAPGQVTALYNFCDQCRQEQKACDTASPPVATTPTPTTPTTPTTPVTTTPVVTPEQYCLKQGGVMVDGVCMTYSLLVKEVQQLRKDLNDLKTKTDLTDIEIDGIKKRLTAIENAKGVSPELREYINGQIGPNMKWVNDKFEAVEYRMGQHEVSIAALSQRDDHQDKRIGKLEEKEDGSGWLGIELQGIFDSNTLSNDPDNVYRAGVELLWQPTLVGVLRALAGVGGAFSGESVNGESLKTIRIEAGVSAAFARFFHLDGGFRTDQTLEDLDLKNSAFYGAFLKPSFCLPWKFTACLGGSAAIGSLTYVGTSGLVTEPEFQAGGTFSFAIQQ